MNFKSITRLAAALTLSLAAMSASATQVTSNFDATLTVVSSCTIAAANLPFGSTPGQITANIDASSSITVNCNPGSAYNVLLSAGTGTGSTVSARKMNSGVNVVSYQLYRDAGRTQVWGSTIGTDTVSGTGAGANQTLTVYGRVPSGQSVVNGSYSSTVTAAVDF